LTAPSLTSSMFSPTPIANSFRAFGAPNQSNGGSSSPGARKPASRPDMIPNPAGRRGDAPSLILRAPQKGKRSPAPMIRRGLPHKGHLRPELHFSRTGPIRPLAASPEIFRALPCLRRHSRPQHLIGPGPAPVLGRPSTSMLSRAALGVL
jgi:hypothetical protein